MTIGNPAVRRILKKTQSGDMLWETEKATYKGVYLKTALYLAITIVAALLTEFLLNRAIVGGQIEQALTIVGIAAAVSIIPLLIISLVIAFVPKTVKVLGCIYALLQGAFVGLLTALVDLFFPGIALAAFLGTVIVMGVSMLLHNLLKVRIGNSFVRCLMVIGASLAALQLVMFLVSLTGFFSYTAYLWVQLAISAVCVIWATVMLFYDLRNIDNVVQMGADKKYEWNVAFSLTTTLIYMYVEILELLMRIAMLFSRNKN